MERIKSFKMLPNKALSTHVKCYRTGLWKDKTWQIFKTKDSYSNRILASKRTWLDGNRYS